MSNIYIFLTGITVIALTIAFLAYFDIPKTKADGRR